MRLTAELRRVNNASLRAHLDITFTEADQSYAVSLHVAEGADLLYQQDFSDRSALLALGSAIATLRNYATANACQVHLSCAEATHAMRLINDQGLILLLGPGGQVARLPSDVAARIAAAARPGDVTNILLNYVEVLLPTTERDSPNARLLSAWRQNGSSFWYLLPADAIRLQSSRRDEDDEELDRLNESGDLSTAIGVELNLRWQ